MDKKKHSKQVTKIPSKEEIEIGNELIAKFMGYIYTYEANEDHSDIGGLITKVKYYSKVPLTFKYVDEDGVNDELFRTSENEYQYIAIRIGGYYSDFQLDSELQYHLQWNYLMPVCKKCLEHKNELNGDEFWSRDCIWWDLAYCDIQKSWNSVINFIQEYNKTL